MITKFIRKRNVNPALPFSKNFARVQVSGSTLTFNFKKRATSTPPVTADRLLNELGDFINTESSDRLNIG
jgi:hypothetical protein